VRWFLLAFSLTTCTTLPPKAPATPVPLVSEAVVERTPPRSASEAVSLMAGGTILEEHMYGGDGSIDGGTLAIDAQGNRFVVGSFRGRATFGDLAPITSEQEDAYFAKLDGAGRPLFVKRIGGTGLDYGGDVVVDAESHVYVSGAFASSTIDLGSGPLRCAGIHDLFLGKFDEDGRLLWARRYGDEQDQINLRLRADPAGGVAMTGWFKGTVDFGAGPVRSPYNRASFVARVDAEGRARWSTWFGYRYDFAEPDSGFDADGNLYVSGGSDARPPAKNDMGPVLLTFDGRGQRLALRRFGSGADNLSTAVAVDRAGGVRLIVGSRGTVDFGLRPQNGEEALYIASFDKSGALTWSRKLMTSRILSVAAARIDAQGNTIIAGQFDEAQAEYRTRESGYVLAIDARGNLLWRIDIARGGVTWLSGLAFDPHGQIVVTGAVLRIDGQRMLNGLYIATLAK
jgi:hypothetical protein